MLKYEKYWFNIFCFQEKSLLSVFSLHYRSLYDFKFKKAKSTLILKYFMKKIIILNFCINFTTNNFIKVCSKKIEKKQEKIFICYFIYLLPS